MPFDCVPRPVQPRSRPAYGQSVTDVPIPKRLALVAAAGLGRIGPCDTSSLHVRLATCMIGASHGRSSSNSTRAGPLSPTQCGSLPPTICGNAARSCRSDRHELSKLIDCEEDRNASGGARRHVDGDRPESLTDEGPVTDARHRYDDRAVPTGSDDQRRIRPNQRVRRRCNERVSSCASSRW